MESVAHVGQKNQIEIFLTALEKCVRALTLYSYGSGQSTLENVFDNTVAALERALLDNDEIEIQVKPFEMIFERKAVYSNKEKKTSLSFALYEAGVRMISFKRGLDRDELKKIISVLSTDFSKQEFMDDDLYSLFLEQNFPHMRVLGADLLQEQMEKDPEFKVKLHSFASKVTQKQMTAIAVSPRKLRPEDVKILEEFRLNSAQFSRPDSDVQKLVQSLTADRNSPRNERQTLERLLLMGFHFLINDQDGQQVQVGRDLVGRITLMSLQAQMLDLFEAIIQKVVALQKSNPAKTGEYQKILDAIYHIDHLSVYQALLKLEAGEEKLIRILSMGPSSAVKLMILLIGEYPQLSGRLQESILRFTPLYLNWMLELVAKQPQMPSWERLVTILSVRPSVHYQKLLQLMLEGCGTTLRFKVLRILSEVGGEEALKTFDQILKGENKDERLLIYELLAKVPHRSALLTLKAHLDSERFSSLDLDEREKAYCVVIEMGGELSFQYFAELWAMPGSGMFRKKSETERRLLILRSLLSSGHHKAPEFLNLISQSDLDSTLKPLIEKLKGLGTRRGAS